MACFRQLIPLAALALGASSSFAFVALAPGIHGHSLHRPVGETVTSFGVAGSAGVTEAVNPLTDSSSMTDAATATVTSLLPRTDRHLLAGRLRLLFAKLLITPAKAREVWSALRNIVYVGDVVIIGFWGLATVPVVRVLYNFYVRGGDLDDISTKNFRDTILFQVADHISRVARLGGIVYACDILSVVLKVLGFTFPRQSELSSIVATVVYTVWVASRIMVFKRFLIGKAVSSTSDNLGKASLYDRILDGIIYFAMAVSLVQSLSVPMGGGVKSLFAVGGIGTAFVGFASKDVVAEFVSGLAVSTANKFYEGDEILLGDGTTGVVHKIGWVYTDIRGFDDIIMKIPNSKINAQPISNFSRTYKSQVRQTLRFKYTDVNKIPKLLEDIKQEIKAACPRLITDGHRPFNIHWRAFKEDHLEVVIDTHYNIKPYCKDYYDNQQVVLETIASVAQKNDVEFAIPSSAVKLNDP